MSRRRRVDFEGAIHHVMNRGVDRQTVFFADADRVEFGQRLASIHSDFGVETLAYCLMDNHYHLLLRTPHAGLSDAMQQLGSLYTRHTNDRVGRDGPLFRGRFHSLPVTTTAYLVWVARYIHRNPLSLPNVGAPAAYRWSSYRTYLRHRRRPPFLVTEPLLSMFDHDVRRLAEMTDGPDVPFELDPAAPTDDLVQLVRFTIAGDDLLSHDAADETRVLERSLLLLVASETHPGTELNDTVLLQLDFPSATARRMALHRARQRLGTDPVLQRTLARLRTNLGGLPERAA